MKKLLILGLLLAGQNFIANDKSEKPTSFNLEVMKAERILYAEVAVGAGATVACGLSVAIALKNKGGANAGSYIGCAAMYTALRQAVNVYRMDQAIEAKEKALALEQAEKEAKEAAMALEKAHTHSSTKKSENSDWF